MLYAKKITYPDGGAEVTVYVRPDQEEPVMRHSRYTRSDEEQEQRREEAQKRGRHRAATKVRRAIRSAALDHLITLGTRADITDRETFRRKVERFCNLMKMSLPAWEYVYVLEKHKVNRPDCWHGHLAVKGWQNLPLLRRRWAQATGCDVRDISVDVQAPRFRGPRDLSVYLSKYLIKDNGIARAYRRHRYGISQGVVLNIIKMSVEPFESINDMDIMGAIKQWAGLEHLGSCRNLWMTDNLWGYYMEIEYKPWPELYVTPTVS